jgi:HTH-type transcriptional regulator/antitoxin MqsA
MRRDRIVVSTKYRVRKITLNGLFSWHGNKAFLITVCPTCKPNLSGARCAGCSEVYLDDASHARFAAAGNAAVLAQREEEQKMLMRVRKKLKLTQHQAAQLTGGGHNAFGRYERGTVRPLPAVVNLFRLLNKHPTLLREIR